MADIDSSLPIRTQVAGQANADDLIAKIGDGTDPSQLLSVDATGKVAAKISDGSGNAISSQASGAQRALDVGVNVAGVQVDPRDTRALTNADVVTVEQGAASSAAAGWFVRPTDGTNSQQYTASGEAEVSITQPLPAGTNAIGTVKSQLQDNAGTAITVGQKAMASSLPVVIASDQTAIPVSISAAAGDSVNDYNTDDAVVEDASSNHDYTVTALKTLSLKQVYASASGRMKIEVKVETGVGAGTYTTKFVGFNSASNPNISVKLESPISVAAGVKVRVTRTNIDKATQDLYSTICGTEV